MRPLLLVLAAQVAVWSDPQPPPASREPITITLDGDKIQYSLDRKHATLEGNVRILVSAPGYTARRAVVRSDRVEVDLEKHVITTQGGSKILVGPAVFTGERVWLDADKEEFRIHGAEGMMGVPPAEPTPGAPEPMAFFKGQTVGKTGDVMYVFRGRITTCDRDDPHYAIVARRIAYNVQTGEASVYDARLRLYGLNFPRLPWAKARIGGKELPRRFDPITIPGYSSREGIYLPYTWAFTGPNAPWFAASSFRVTAKRGITGSVWAKRSTGDWDLEVRAGRKEWQADDISDRLSISRVPELNVTHYLSGRGSAHQATALSLSFGRYEEDWENQPVGRPRRRQVEENRALAALTYTVHPQQYARHDGSWYGARGRISAYSSDETFRELQLFAGAGTPVGENAHAYATLIHHFEGGSTPFLFDDVDIQTELALGADWEPIPNWMVKGWGRYDVEETELRDYEIGLSHRAHCLTWGVFYRDVGSRVGLRVDLTGFTGGTRPLESHSRLQQRLQQEGLSIAAPEEGQGKLNIRGEPTPSEPAAGP